MKGLAKRGARLAALVAVSPRLLTFAIRARMAGRDPAFNDSMQALSHLPGYRGRYVRAAFLSQVLPSCAADVMIEMGTHLSQAGATFGEHVYVGPGCVLGWVHVERDVIIASGVAIPSGPETHGTSRLDVPIRLQPGTLRPIRIGEGAWIGANVLVLAAVGRGTVVAAGAVVVDARSEHVFAAGVPARVIKTRLSGN